MTTKWELSPIIRKRMPLEIKKDDLIIPVIREVIKKVTGEYPLFRGIISPGDCAHLVKAGIPAVMYGPGNNRVTHITNEWIEI